MKTVYDMAGKRHDFSEDYTDEEITRILSDQTQPVPAGAANAGELNPDKLTPGPKWLGAIPIPNRGQIRDFSLDMIPQVAGLAGAIDAGPVGAGAAQLGGRFVELGIKKLAGLPVPETPQALGADLAVSGAEGVINDLGGKVFAGATGLVGNAGKKMLENAVAPSSKLLEKFPNTMKVIAKNGLNVGDVEGIGGSQVAADLRSASGNKLKGILKRADKTGATLDPVALMPDVNKIVSGLPGDMDRGVVSDHIHDMIGRFLDNYSGPLSPSDVKLIKQIHQRASQKLLNARDAGTILSPAQDMEMQFRKGVADQAQGWLENLPKYGKQIAKQEANTKGLIGAQKALKAAELKPNRVVNIPYVPPAIGDPTHGWIPREVGRSPSEMSQLGNRLNRNFGWATGNVAQQTMKNLPRGADALARALYDLNHEPDSTVTR